MATLKYVGDLVIDSTGPLRKTRLPDGLYVVGEQMLIPVDSEQEADEVIEQLRSEYEFHCGLHRLPAKELTGGLAGWS